MQPHLKWLVIAAMVAGYCFPAASWSDFAARPPVPELHPACGELCPSARVSVFDARQFVRSSVDDAHITPCPTPVIDPATLSFATTAPNGDADFFAAPQTLLALRTRWQP